MCVIVHWNARDLNMIFIFTALGIGLVHIIYLKFRISLLPEKRLSGKIEFLSQKILGSSNISSLHFSNPIYLPTNIIK